MKNPEMPLNSTEEIQIDKYALEAKLERLKEEQNLTLGVVGGIIGGILGAIIWAAITYFTDTKFGLVAIGVGFLVGCGVRLLGKGFDRVFGIAGAIIALLSVFIGNFLMAIGLLTKIVSLEYLEVLLTFDYTRTMELMTLIFSPMDLLFYGFAIYEGYRFSFRKIT